MMAFLCQWLLWRCQWVQAPLSPLQPVTLSGITRLCKQRNRVVVKSVTKYGHRPKFFFTWDFWYKSLPDLMGLVLILGGLHFCFLYMGSPKSVTDLQNLLMILALFIFNVIFFSVQYCFVYMIKMCHFTGRFSWPPSRFFLKEQCIFMLRFLQYYIYFSLQNGIFKSSYFLKVIYFALVHAPMTLFRQSLGH